MTDQMPNEPQSSDEDLLAVKENAPDEFEVLKAKNQKMRKRLLMILAGIGGVMLLFVLLILLLNLLLPKDDSIYFPDIEFEPTYAGNIFENEAYLARNPEVIMYSPDATGNIRYSIEKGNEELDATVWFLRDFIRSMTFGDQDIYNSFFSDFYFSTHERQAAFSPQMVYDAEIRFISLEDQSSGEKVYTYQLRYRILQNDGTLRREVGSDAIVPQYVILRVRADGSIAIEDTYVFREITKQ